MCHLNMSLRVCIIAILAAVLVQLLLPPSVVTSVRTYIKDRAVALVRCVFLSRYFPDGLLSIGALLLIRDFLVKQLRSIWNFVRRKDGVD